MRKCRRDGKVPVENVTHVPRTLKSYVSSLYFGLFFIRFLSSSMKISEARDFVQ